MQLQNNNPTQFNRHGGTAQKQNPYIEEKKATNIYQPDNNTIMASGTMELMNKGLQLTDNVIQKTNQINAINKYNDWKIDYKNITEEYKFDYAKNPENGSELTKKYNEKLLKLQSDYEKQIPPLHRDSFIKKTNDIYEANNLDLFTKGVDLQYQSNRYINNLNNKLEQSEQDTYNNNYETLNNIILELPEIEQQTIDILGKTNGEKTIKAFKHNLLTENIGTMIYDNPTTALETIDNIINNNNTKNILKPKEIEELKSTAIKRKEDMDKWQKERDVAEYYINYHSLLKDIEDGKIQNNFSDIIKAMIASDLDAEDCKIILKQTGYDNTPLPQELVEHLKNKQQQIKQQEQQKQQTQKEINNTTKSQPIKLTNLQKEEANVLISKKIDFLYSLDKDNTKSQEQLRTDIKQLNKELNIYLEMGLLTREEYRKHIDEIQPLLNTILTSRTEREYKDKIGWIPFFKEDIGRKKIYDTIDKALLNHNIENKQKIDNKNIDDLLDAKTKNIYYRINNGLLNSYNEAMDYIAQREKQNNPAKYKDANSFRELNLDNNRRKTLYNEGYNLAVTAYTNNMSIPELVKALKENKFERKTNEEIDKDLNRYINDVRIRQVENDILNE